MVTLVDNIVYLPPSDDFLNSNGVLNSMVKSHLQSIVVKAEGCDTGASEVVIRFEGEVKPENNFSFTAIVECEDEVLREAVGQAIRT